MKRIAGRGLAALCAAAVALVATERTALAQSYPKLLVNGNGLALTRLAISEKQGTSWVSSPALRQGVDYRFTVRLSNFFPSDIDLEQTYFDIKLAFATFSPQGSLDNVTMVNSFQSRYDPVPLKPTQSRSYYVYFTWSGPSIAMPSVSVSVGIDGTEVKRAPLPNMNPVPIKPTS